jgi:hypothetical protein
LIILDEADYSRGAREGAIIRGFHGVSPRDLWNPICERLLNATTACKTGATALRDYGTLNVIASPSARNDKKQKPATSRI